MIIDFRALNEKIIGDVYPLSNITEILDQLGSAKYFSVCDLASGFHRCTNLTYKKQPFLRLIGTIILTECHLS